MVAQNADEPRHKLGSIGVTKRPSFSDRDLDYKLKMLQLTLVYRHSVVENRLPSIGQPTRHSISQETFAKVKPLLIEQPFHRPKILAVEPKLIKDTYQKPGKPLVSITSATLPSNPQQSKVQRLVQMFETGTNTAPKKSSRLFVKPPKKQQATLGSKVPQPSPPKKNTPVSKMEESAPNDDQIRADLKQRKKLDSR